MSLSAIHCIFRLGVSVFILAGMTSCDDAPETPAQKSSEIKKDLRKLQKEKDTRKLLNRDMDKRLSRTARESAPFTVRSIEMRVNGQTVTLSTAEKDRVIALGTALCDSIGKAGEVGKDKVKQASKVETDKLISALSDMGHTAASIKITNGQDGSNYKEQIHFDWQGKNQKTACLKGNF